MFMKSTKEVKKFVLFQKLSYVLFVPLQSVPKTFESFKMHHIEKFVSILFGKILGACHSVFTNGLDS
jgi:hypothetical protein